MSTTVHLLGKYGDRVWVCGASRLGSITHQFAWLSHVATWNQGIICEKCVSRAPLAELAACDLGDDGSSDTCGYCGEKRASGWTCAKCGV